MLFFTLGLKIGYLFRFLYPFLFHYSGMIVFFLLVQCDALIVEYGKEIIQLLVNQLKPKTICTEIKLCSASGVKMVYESKPKGEVSCIDLK